MGKRHLVDSYELEPPRKRAATNCDIEPGDILCDITGKQWRLGQLLGSGAFGEIYVASDCNLGVVPENSPYVAKLELHTNGPLFIETHFYLKVAKENQIKEWKRKNRKTIGMPHYIASGSHTKLTTRYRFLILPRYNVDLQQILERHGNKFNIKTVLTIALQLLDTLEYIHAYGIVHADIKASNILINEKTVPPNTNKFSSEQPPNKPTDENCRIARHFRLCRLKKKPHNLRSSKILPYRVEPLPTERDPAPIEQNQNIDPNQVYLLDFGLSCKYLQSNGEHKKYCVDARKAHAGTILYCSLDAHNGVQSRRSDLESLGYNMVHWLTGVLPWMTNVDEYEIVKKKKQICMQELEHFLHFCFGKNIPTFLKNFFMHVKSLNFDEKPDYEYCRKIFLQGFNEYGYKKVFVLDFMNKEGWGLKKKLSKNTENDRRRASVVCSIMRTPLKSNVAVKHVLRKKDKAKAVMRWSKILFDPEMIIKSGKRVKELEENDNSDALANLNIQELNPTDTMLEVYNNYLERQKNFELGLPTKQRSNETPAIEGYNATMMRIYKKILQREVEAVKTTKPPKVKRTAGKHGKISKVASVNHGYNMSMMTIHDKNGAEMIKKPTQAKRKRSKAAEKVVIATPVTQVTPAVPVKRYNTRHSKRTKVNCAC